jgi:hypothetical protein
MKNLIVAGILGTMLTLTNGARTANAYEGRDYHRTVALGAVRYGHRNGDFRYAGHVDRNFVALDRHDSYGPLECGTGVRYETSYHYRPYATTYRYDRDLHVTPRLAYGVRR